MNFHAIALQQLLEKHCGVTEDCWRATNVSMNRARISSLADIIPVSQPTRDPALLETELQLTVAEVPCSCRLGNDAHLVAGIRENLPHMVQRDAVRPRLQTHILARLLFWRRVRALKVR